MPSPTPELGLQKALDSDDNADYLDTALASSLATIDSLFNNVTGHTHGDVHQGGPITSIPSSAIPDGSITSAKITDGSIATVDLADGIITAAKLGAGSVTTPALAASLTLTSPTINNATENSPTLNSPAIGNPTINGTIAGSATFTSGPSSNDWFRANTVNTGIYNAAVNAGVGFDAGGPFVYGAYGGGHLITESAAQTLTNKTINSPQINSPAIASPTMSNPSINGTLSGAPAWANAQSFPAGSLVGGLRMVATHSGSEWIIDSGTIFFNAVPSGGAGTQQAANFNGAYTAAPYVICQIRDTSGGTNSVQHTGVEARGVGTNGFFAAVDNQTGSTQSLWVDWIAMGH